MPRDQATMPYWVPQVLRSQKKVRGKLAGQRGLRVSVGRGGTQRGEGWVLGSFPSVASSSIWGPLEAVAQGSKVQEVSSTWVRARSGILIVLGRVGYPAL